MHPRAAEFTEQASERYGIDLTVEEFPEGTKTAAAAADAVGCETAQIASSLAFTVKDDLVVVVTSGANRVSEAKLADFLGVAPASVEMASPDRISDTLGWSIGGVPPLCHASDVPMFFDETLLEFETVWAAAGTPQSVFPIDPERLRTLADAPAIDVAE